jgi:hypothetical protein
MPSWYVKAKSWDVAQPDLDDCDDLLFIPFSQPSTRFFSCLNPLLLFKIPFQRRRWKTAPQSHQTTQMPAYMRNERLKRQRPILRSLACLGEERKKEEYAAGGGRRKNQEEQLAMETGKAKRVLFWGLE